MTTEKRGHPVAVCSICGAFEYQMQMINDRCPVRSGGKQCKGALIGAMAADDWKGCAKCEGSGSRDGSDCPDCRGSGWRYLRERVGIYR